MGRPSLYNLEYCERVIEFGKEGMSLSAMAAQLEVNARTMRNWEIDEDKPEFAEAMQMARTYSQAWWEEWGRMNINNPKANAAMWMKNMAARFRDDWSDRQVIAGDPTAPMRQLVEYVIVDPENPGAGSEEAPTSPAT